ncbi:MAG: beta-galactosidase, partial [Bacteroidia bacterium]|nr:beta-galactosidase [Bacteroidia bacterium]
MKIKIFLALSTLALLPLEGILSQSKINLAGEWQFATDPKDKGISEHWFSKNLAETVALPGSMAQNGKGNEITVNTRYTGDIVDSSYFKRPSYAKYREPGNIKLPFWLQAVKYYAGAAWYQKEVTVPKNWKGQSIGLFLERCHWESRVWVDNQEVGMQNSLGTAHKYDLTKWMSPGKHRLTICIDNRIKDIDPGVNSHSISDHTQSNWNGMVGQLYLESRPLVKITSIQVFPDIKNKRIAVKVTMNNPKGKIIAATLKLAVSEFNKTSDFELKAGENTKEIVLNMGDNPKLWSEFHPNLYTLKASLKEKSAKTSDQQSTTFGMREFKVIGKQISINDKPVFLRGTLECAIFPKTGYPAMDEASWLRIFNICRAHGLNHVRFHSWCPPEAAFSAADKTGFYLQVECSSWANQSTTIGDGKAFDTYLYEESQRMVQAYGNHPSFCMMAYGNEPAGANQSTFLTSFVRFWKERDSRRIYTSSGGWPNLPISDYLSDQAPRIQRWGEGMKSIINAQAPSTLYDWSTYINKFNQPMVSHEIGQWCAYPNFKEIAKYDGVLKARNFEIFQETLKEH